MNTNDILKLFYLNNNFTIDQLENNYSYICIQINLFNLDSNIKKFMLNSLLYYKKKAREIFILNNQLFNNSLFKRHNNTKTIFDLKLFSKTKYPNF